MFGESQDSLTSAFSTNTPLRVKPEVAEEMLRLKLYADIHEGDLISLARAATKGRVLINDKATAIAVMMGQSELEARCPDWIKDRTKRIALRGLFTRR